MTTHVLQFVELSDRERKAAKPLDKGDHVEVKVRRKSGQDQVVRLPRRLQPCSRLPSAISSKGSGSRSSPRIRNSARTTRQTSWESRDRWSCIAWTEATSRSDILASIAARSLRTYWR